MIPKYKFYILQQGVKKEAHPVFGSDLALQYAKQSGEVFFRKSLSQGITFVRGDFDFIMSAPIDEEITFICDFSADFGLTYTEYFRATFTRIDGEIDYDSNTIKVTPSVQDEYGAFLDGIENEYNIIKLPLETMRVNYFKRGMLQMYVPNDNVVSCFLSGMYFEQDAEATGDTDLLKTKYHFKQTDIYREINVTMDGSPDVSGTYYGRANLSQYTEETTLESVEGNYKMHISIDLGGLTISIYQSGGEILFREYWDPSAMGWFQDEAEFVLPAISQSASGRALCAMRTKRIFARFVTDVESVLGSPTYALPADDIVENNRNYKRVAPFNFAIQLVTQGIRLSDEPTEYGTNESGKYYLPPESELFVTFYPVARSTWGNTSFWYRYRSDFRLIEQEYETQIQLRDAYPIASVIKVLLSQFAPNITHEETPEYSEFLYSSLNPISGEKYRLLCTPKSNIIVGEYQMPAQKAFTTLRQILSMLQNVYQVYFHIEDGKLRLEHILWYKNGGSYIGAQEIGRDLTAELNVRNGKPLAYATSKISFDKNSLPARYEFGWMDDCTEPFNGLPIEVKSNLVKKDQKEEIEVANFTSDIDYITLNPQSVSQDGFALLAARPYEVLKNPNVPTRGFGFSVLSMPAIELNPQIGMATLEVMASAEYSGYGLLCLIVNGERKVYNDMRIDSGEQKTFVVDIPEGTSEMHFIVFGRIEIYPLSMQSHSIGSLLIEPSTIGNTTHYLQNGNLAFSNLQPNFWVYDLPAEDVVINERPSYARSIKRGKKQNVTFPVVNADADTNKLVKTFIGNGQIEQMNINLSSRTAQTTLCYDTK